MKKSIKKRIKDGEIEEAKIIIKKNKTLVVLSSIFLILIVILGLLIINTKNIIKNKKVDENKKEKLINPKTHDEVNSKKNETEEEFYEEIDIDESIKELLYTVHSHRDSSGDSTIYNSDGLTIDKMSDYYKFELACNIYCPKVNKNTSSSILGEIDEEVVKESYEKLFGENTYKSLEQIPYYNNDLIYDENGRYLTTVLNSSGESTLSSKEVILNVKKSDKELLITTAVLFVEKNYLVICRDYNCMKTLERLKNFGENYFIEYINNNKEDLMQYTYKFKIEEDNYYYNGFERTNK